ncbi:hypothetical protein CDAR_611561 [Caerostris darwini]|uniref:Uncharacterized protein n=1 Tax=Caerostris darwini TaxID=1538125 RepID=A0AAV4U2T4_9ARAC|nr:hypothetical protein CDAR_611561 [Caerostris darwini]
MCASLIFRGHVTPPRACSLFLSLSTRSCEDVIRARKSTRNERAPNNVIFRVRRKGSLELNFSILKNNQFSQGKINGMLLICELGRTMQLNSSSFRTPIQRGGPHFTASIVEDRMVCLMMHVEAHSSGVTMVTAGVKRGLTTPPLSVNPMEQAMSKGSAGI